MRMRTSKKTLLFGCCVGAYYIVSSQFGLYFCDKPPDESISGLVSLIVSVIVGGYMAKSGAEKYTNKKFETTEKEKEI